MGILRSVTAKQDAPEPERPARQAFETWRTQVKAIATELADLHPRYASVQAALTAEEAKLDAVPALREKVEQLEASIQAAVELGGGMIDATPLVALKEQFAQAEREAVPAAKRVKVERTKLATLADRLTKLRTAQSDLQAQHGSLAWQALREHVRERIVPCEASREALLANFDPLFVACIACDRVAIELKTGEFVNSQTWADLVIPTPAGMAELPESQAAHGQRLEAAAIELLREYGLHE